MRNIAFGIAIFTFGAAFAQSRTELLAPLTGAGKGKATFKTRGAEAELQIEGENLRKNAKYNISVAGGRVVATVTTNVFGRFEVRRSLRGVLPQVKVGDKVFVTLASTQGLAISGSFRTK